MVEGKVDEGVGGIVQVRFASDDAKMNEVCRLAPYNPSALKCVHLLILLTLGLSLVAKAESHDIGVILPLSGEAAPFGAIVRRGIERSQNGARPFLYEDDACQGRPTENVLYSYPEITSGYLFGQFVGVERRKAESRDLETEVGFVLEPISTTLDDPDMVIKGFDEADGRFVLW